MTGFVPYNFIRECLAGGSTVLVRNETMIKKTRVTGLIYPLTHTLVSMVNLGLSIAAMLVILLFLRVLGTIEGPHPQLILLPVGVILLAMFCFGLSLLTMVATTYFRDLEHIITVFLRAFYFGTPILYSIGFDQGPGAIGPNGQVVEAVKDGFVKTVEGPFAEILRYNPLMYYFQFFRCGIYGQTGWWPAALTWPVTIGGAGFSLVAGYSVFNRFEHEYVYRL